MAGETDAWIDAARKYYATMVDSACDRWKNAAGEIEAGTYTFAKATKDAYSYWADATASWWAISLGAAGPYVSYVLMKIAAAKPTPSTITLPGTYGQPPLVTDLTEIGGTTVLSVANGDVQIVPTTGGANQYDIEVLLPAGTPVGVYLGLAYGLAKPVFVYVSVE